MATYLPGVPQYIPQIQPYQPDLNFMANVLQTKQNAYDKNYDALSKRYGTLLNSPMMRQDNIEKRQEFFNAIDNDIKKISGMDLSLQQNVDSADSVFDSFLQNKDIVHDMSFTREYQNQLQAGESLRNCIDQEQCGGKYSETAAKALHYRADEYKKASQQDAMTMSPGRFTPFINMQEKAVKYVQNLLGKDGTGAFGVEKVIQDKSGRYNIKLTNGEILAVPLNDLMMNQYGQDQAVKDMYNTEAYVHRKDFISSNLQFHNNDEVAAEDAYFSGIDMQVQKAKADKLKADDQKKGTDAKKKILEKQIKEQGTTGDDDIANAFLAAGLDDAAATQTVARHDEAVKLGDSIFEAGENRASKRQRVDAFFSKSLMQQQIGNSAVYAANATGRMSQEEDKYKLKEVSAYLDFSLDMKKQERQYQLMGGHEKLKAQIDFEKQKALMEHKKRGSAITGDNKPVPVAMQGTSAAENLTDENKELKADRNAAVLDVNANTKGYVNGYAQTLLNIIKSNTSAEESTTAERSLIKIYNQAQYDQSGKLIAAGYDPASKSFIDVNGNKSDNPDSLYTANNSHNLYKNAKLTATENKALTSHKAFLDNEGHQYLKNLQTGLDLYKTSSTVWKQNNKVVKNLGQYENVDDQTAWNAMFNSDHDMKSYTDFAKDYKREYANTHYEQPSESDVVDKWEAMHKDYDKIYASSPKGMSALHGTTMFGKAGGGKSAGNAYMYTVNTGSPASEGSRGLVGIFDDANNNGIFTMGNKTTVEEAKNGADANAKTAMETFIGDFRAGNLTAEEKKSVAGQLYYMDLALSDPKYSGGLFKLPQSWLDKYKGSTKETTDDTWADDAKLSEGVGMYFDKASATNDLTKVFKQEPYDIILEHTTKTIDIPNGGNITINKRNSDGSFTVSGNILSYSNGKLVPISVPTSYPSESSGQKLWDGFNYLMEDLAAKNAEAMQDKPRTFNPNDIQQIQSTLAKMSGAESTGPSTSDQFLQALNGL